MKPPCAPTPPVEPASVALIGSGWRAEFILGVITALPQWFALTGMVVRTPEKAARMAAEFGAPTFGTLDELLAHRRPDFAVLSIPRSAAPAVIAQAVRADLPILTETPPADTDVDLVELFRAVGTNAPVQVAEQYPLHPLIAAQIAIARAGTLGTVREARVSISHGYHAISIMRRMLDLGFEDATITASRFDAPIIGGPGRSGDPTEEKILTAELTIAHLDFGDRYGIYDWAPAQNRSWIRRTHLLARGERGEIDGLEVRYLKDVRTPMQYTIRRVDTGQFTNFEGHYLRGLIAGEEWVYTNPFAPAPLVDDEIAVAQCLVRMAEFARGGVGFYSLAEASQDHYLGNALIEAARTGRPVRTTPQIWA